jgi:hypothetical protein
MKEVARENTIIRDIIIRQNNILISDGKSLAISIKNMSVTHALMSTEIGNLLRSSLSLFFISCFLSFEKKVFIIFC